ncbi:tyrosine-type recombinase/integrase [Rummeliibacillus sp. JY-2-4R]
MDNYWELTKQLLNKENQEKVSEFLLNLKLSNHSESTIKTYRLFLEKFFINQQESFSSLSSEAIIKWYREHYEHVKESTFKRCLSILSSFFTFCVQEGYLELSPIKRSWFPRLPKPVPKYLDKADIAKIRQQSEKGPLRNQVLVELMLTSGCRVGEVHRLNLKDVDMENRIATVVGKGKKVRQVHFNDKCAILLDRYLDTRKEVSSSALFISFTTGKRLGIRQIQGIIEKTGEKAGLDKKLHPHRFRHTFATELLAKGAELTFIGAELGHSDIATTQIYARLPKKEIIAEYRKFMG